MTYTQSRWIIVCILVIICAIATVAAIVAGQRLDTINDLKQQNKELVVQNVQLTKDARQAEAEAFKMGLITCSNEDVDYLNDLANEYAGTPLAKMFRQMAMGWAYDDDTMQSMIESYMEGDTL